MKLSRVILVVLLMAATTGAMAQDNGPWLATHYQPGNIAFSLGAGFGAGYSGFGIALYPGAEFIFTKVRPLGIASVDFGAGIKGVAALSDLSSGTSYFTAGGAPFLSAHFGLRGFTGSDLATYLNQLDFFTSFGLGYVASLPLSGGTADGGLTFANFSGLNYFLNESIAITVNSNYFYSWNVAASSRFSGGIGIVYKIGPAEELGERVDIGMPDMTGMTGDMMYLNFTALYWSSIVLGGYLPSDETFEDGDGIRFWHRYRSADDDDVEEMEFERALLHTNADGSRWWRFVFYVDDEELAYEALVNTDGGIEQFRYLDPGTEQVATHAPSDPYVWEQYEEGYWTSEDLAELRVGSERVRVPAGSFLADKLESSEEGYTYTWWLSDDVPGRVVKFEGTSEDMENVSGELLEVMRNVTTPWSVPW